MGCKQCSTSDEQNELKMDISNHPQEYTSTKEMKRNYLSEMIFCLQNLGFTRFCFQKQTSHQVIYEKVGHKWRKSSNKVITLKGVIEPLNLVNLVKANTFLQDLRRQIASGENKTVTQFDDSMIFKCALQVNHPVPNLEVTLLGQEGKHIINFGSATMTIVRSWNLSEQMLNFERAVEFVQGLEQRNIQIELIGVCRGTIDQKSQFLSAIQSNKWNHYRNIFLDQDQPEENGWILDVDYDQAESDNILSTLFLHNGVLVYKRYEHEMSFASDADEVELELQRLIQNPNTAAQPPKEQKITLIQEINKETYRNFKKILFMIPQQQTNKVFSRDLHFSLSKTVIYKDGLKSQVGISTPKIQIATSPKTLTQTQQLTELIRSHAPGVDCIVWDRQLLIDMINSMTRSQYINVQIVLEKFIRIKKNTLTIENKPWEECNLMPRFASTDCFQQMIKWIKLRDEILPQLQKEMNSIQNNIVERTLCQISYDFMRIIPTVQQVINTPYGAISYCEKRNPPYDERQSNHSGQDLVRAQDKILIIFLMDYENDDTMAILKDLIQIRQKDGRKDIQLVVLGHIRAESWTELFPAFVEMKGLDASIRAGIIQTWFPMDDRIQSVSFQTVLGKIYGLQLERRDIMVVDKKNMIRSIDSSRKIVQQYNSLLDSMGRDNESHKTKEDSQNEVKWHKIKAWCNNVDLTQYANNQADEGMESNRGGEYFLEQKVTKIRIDGQYTKVYDAPYFDISQPLPQIIQSLADTIQIK